MNNDAFLAHYGVKGMKWGVRKKTEAIKKYASESRAKKDKSDRDYYEGRYLKKGFSKEEASDAAQRKIDRDRKARKIIAASAAVALTAAVTYVAYKKIDRDFLSVNLPVDTPLKNINPRGKGQNLDRHLYVTYKNSDTNKYRGLLANNYRKKGELLKKNPIFAHLASTSVYETTLSPKTTIKAPSNRQAEKIYREFSKKNPDTLGMSYRMFNKHFATQDNDARDAFFKEVAKKGYNAVIDTNDQWTSGYNTRKPLILMNAGKVASEKHTEKLLDSVIDKTNKRETAKVYLPIGAKAGLQLGVVTAGYTKALRNERRRSQKMFVANYRKQHPKSKLSDAEILSKI